MILSSTVVYLLPCMDNSYYHDPESAKKYIQIAEGYNGQKLIEQLKRFLPKDSSVLELGVGPGTDLLLLNETYQATGSDYSPAFIQILKQKHPELDLLELDAISLQTTRSFEGIFSNKVLQHLNDQELETSIQNQLRILYPGGIICHSFWRGEGSMEMKGLLHTYHSEKDLRRFFGSHFDILYLESYREEEKDDSLLLIGRKT